MWWVPFPRASLASRGRDKMCADLVDSPLRGSLRRGWESLEGRPGRPADPRRVVPVTPVSPASRGARRGVFCQSCHRTSPPLSGIEQESPVRRSRRSVLSAAALGLALAATGCTYMSPVQTKEFYQAADGTNANIQAEDGALFAGVRNAVLVIGEDGTPMFSASVASYASEEFYPAADGTNANCQAEDGALFAGVGNPVLVIGEDGTPLFSASVASYASEEITVSLEGLSEGSTLFSTEVQVPAHGVVELGP